MEIPRLKLPRQCCCCRCEILGRDGPFPYTILIDFRLCDYSTATMSFCAKCACEVSEKDFTALDDMALRGAVVSSFYGLMEKPDLARKEPDGTTTLNWPLKDADDDWDGFMEKHMNPVPQVSKKRFQVAFANPHVSAKDGKNRCVYIGSPFPILAIARYRRWIRGGEYALCSLEEVKELAK